MELMRSRSTEVSAENAAEENFEFDAWRKIPSVGAEVDAANNDFRGIPFR